MASCVITTNEGMSRNIVMSSWTYSACSMDYAKPTSGFWGPASNGLTCKNIIVIAQWEWYLYSHVIMRWYVTKMIKSTCQASGIGGRESLHVKYGKYVTTHSKHRRADRDWRMSRRWDKVTKMFGTHKSFWSPWCWGCYVRDCNAGMYTQHFVDNY